ncbi:MAG TPA: hypothetical protein VEB66_08965 [Opitutaceae bacterium]|nr:hypothetical protein [Opitutaceae bacterium]HYF09172.1 hypothetical protein [Acetobacteraceae bacterium]
MDSHASPPSLDEGDSIDFRELLQRARRGLPRIAGLALVGLAVGLGCGLVISYKRTAVSALRVTFGFPGFELGTYPNGSRFQPDDVRAPDVVNAAIQRLGVQGLGADESSRIRGAIGISGFISPGIIKERDRLRASGQNLPPYFPDEYEISLSLPRDFPLAVRHRELLLAEIVNVYLEKFRRTYVDLPDEFVNPFAALRDADFVEYELILTREMQSVLAYLEEKIDIDSERDGPEAKKELARARAAKQFRSPTNNLSFQDLFKQAQLFSQIRLNDVLSQIYVHGLSKDREHALVKMDYHLRTLEDREQRLKEEESVVTELLSKTQERAQSYVVASKVQNPSGGQPIMDQAFIDSLLANDAYNFLVRRALEAGLEVKRVQAEKARLQERRQRMRTFTTGQPADQAAAIAAMQKTLTDLEGAYQELLTKIRTTMDDYARQEYAAAVRISMQAKTDSILVGLLLAGALGLGMGSALGLGLSLLRESPDRPRV